MTTAGPNSPDTGATSGGAGQPWTNPTRVIASDNSRATCALGTGEDSEYLIVTDFDFAIPATDIIDGIMFEIEASESGGDIRFTAIFATKDGSVLVGSDQEGSTRSITTTDTYYTYGDASSLWGTTWTAAEINATTFGVMIRFSAVGGSSAGTAQVDHVRCTVAHHAAGSIATIVHQYRLRRAT